MRSIMSFGEFLNDLDLAELVWKIFCNSTADSTKRTYSTSTAHFLTFLNCYTQLPAAHYLPDQLSLSGMILCFFIAFLYRRPSINSAATITHYTSSLQSSWSLQGVQLTNFDQSIIRAMKKGIKRLLPQQPDRRAAFLLPHYPIAKNLLHTLNLPAAAT